MRLSRALAFALALAGGAGTVSALVPPPAPEDGGPLPDWDVRGLASLGEESLPTPAQAQALKRLGAQVEATASGSDVVVRWGPRTGTLHHVFARRGYLTLPAAGRPLEDVARRIVTEWSDLLGLDARAVKELSLIRTVTDPQTSAFHAYFEQRLRARRIFHGEVRVNLDRDGRLLSIGGNTVATRQAPGEESVGASAALVDAARSVRVPLQSAPKVAGIAPDGRVTFERGPFAEGPWAHEAWFPRDEGLVPAWVVVLDPKDDTGWYQVVVDARDGSILSRHDLVQSLATQGLVFREDPGQGPQVELPFVDDSAITDAASPEGWSPRGLTEGNNDDAKDDIANDDETTDGRRATGAAGPPRGFDFPFQDNTALDLDASVTNLFYLCNWIHDRLVRLGFDEASGNFQDVNYSGKGRGGDRVYLDAQDGSGRNNANFGTPPDGSHPRMQMYIWTYTNPARDSSFDASVVTHEHFHGVSNRLVGLAANDAGCLGGPQGGAMGEAWSDFYACSFWNQATVGGYLVNDYVNGIRRAPYDQYPFDYGQLCNQGGFEVHRDGEIWAAQLWHIRQAFIDKYGYQRGKCMVERLVLDGMKLSPCFPNMVDMRDAIILAGRLQGADGDACLLWQAFADRGLGVGAVPRADCTSAADASYATPPECASCAAMAGPSSVVVDTSRPNRVSVSFVPAPSADTHLLLRSDAPCPGDCLDAEFVEVARGPGDATLLEDMDRDTSPLSAGRLVSYRLVALQGACHAAAACQEATITGRCTLRPTASGAAIGVQGLARPPGATCSIVVSWAAMGSSCGQVQSLRYNVYRSEDPLFVPGPENLVASVAPPALSWTDAAVPSASVTYVVRAEDLTTGGEGPHGGNEETNDVRLTLAPQGLPTGPATFADDGESGERPGYRRTGSYRPNDWGIVSDANTRGGSAWHVTDVEGGNADKNLVLPPLTLGPSPRLRFVHAFQFEDSFDGGVIEISTDGGTTWRDLIADIVTGGYATSRGAGFSYTVGDLMNPPNTNVLWTGQNASGFPVYDAVDVDLAAYAGTLDAQIRFRALVDPAAAEPGGWYVDDIVVDDVVAFGPCAGACVQPPTAALPDVQACTSTTDATDVALDASASAPGPSGFASSLAYVFTHDGPGSFGGRRWASGPRAVLTFPPGTPAGPQQVTLTVRGADTCSDVQVATVTLADEGPLPARVGPTLRVAKAAGGGLSLSWTDVGAPVYNALLVPIGADLARIASAPPVASPSGSPVRLVSGLAATGAGTAFIQVDSASSCGRSLP